MLIKLIDWGYQSIFNWIGFGLASFIGLFEINIKEKTWRSFSSLIYFVFLGSFLASIQKVFEHWKYIQGLRWELIRDYGWDFTGPPRAQLTTIVDLSLRQLLTKASLWNLFFMILFYFGIEFYFEKRNEKKIIQRLYEFVRYEIL